MKKRFSQKFLDLKRQDRRFIVTYFFTRKCWKREKRKIMERRCDSFDSLLRCTKSMLLILHDWVKQMLLLLFSSILLSLPFFFEWLNEWVKLGEKRSICMWLKLLSENVAIKMEGERWWWWWWWSLRRGRRRGSWCGGGNMWGGVKSVIHSSSFFPFFKTFYYIRSNVHGSSDVGKPSMQIPPGKIVMVMMIARLGGR